MGNADFMKYKIALMLIYYRIVLMLLKYNQNIRPKT